MEKNNKNTNDNSDISIGGVVLIAVVFLLHYLPERSIEVSIFSGVALIVFVAGAAGFVTIRFTSRHTKFEADKKEQKEEKEKEKEKEQKKEEKEEI